MLLAREQAPLVLARDRHEHEFQVSADLPPGEYTVKVNVTDRAAKPAASATVSRKFEVLQPAFGLVRLRHRGVRGL